LHHHGQRHLVHRQKVLGNLRRPSHLYALVSRSSPKDKWPTETCQWHGPTGPEAEILQQIEQTRQEMTRRAPLGLMEPKNNIESSHEVHSIFLSLWVRGCASNLFRVWVPEAESLQRAEQRYRKRKLPRLARGSSRYSFTTLRKVSAESSALPRQTHSQTRPPCR
jgi:hypothetical protein